MGTFGVTNAGFVPMRLADIIQANTAGFQAALGPTIDLSADTPLGQINGVLSASEASVWQILAALVQQFDPDFATGINQDNLYAINNVLREPAIASSMTAANGNPATITGSPGTVIPGTDTTSSPFQASVTGSNHTIVFQATQTVTIPGGGTVSVDMVCTETGPNAAPAGTMVIETPTVGVTACSNSNDATVGQNQESASAFAARRLNDLQRSEAATNGGIRATVALVPGVTQNGLIENDTDSVDGDGLPAHSIEDFAVGGTLQALANALFAAKAAGIQTFGGNAETVTDTQGFTHTIYVSRPTQITIYIVANITLITNPADGQSYPADGDTEVKNNLVAYGQNSLLGADFINPQAVVAVMGVAGILTLKILADTAVLPAAWATSTAYVIGNKVYNGSNLYQCTANGTSATSGPGPTGQGSSITDGTVTWEFVKDLTANIILTPNEIQNIQSANITVNS